MQFVNQGAVQFHHDRNKPGLRSAEESSVSVSATREHPQVEARPKPERAAAARLRTSNAKPKDEQSNIPHVEV